MKNTGSSMSILWWLGFNSSSKNQHTSLIGAFTNISSTIKNINILLVNGMLSLEKFDAIFCQLDQTVLDLPSKFHLFHTL